MAVDAALLAKARTKLEASRAEHERKLNRRTQEVYEKSPRIREIDAQLRASMAGFIGIALGKEEHGTVSDLCEKNTKLQQQRKDELVKAGYSRNYLDDDYLCVKCSDTGYVQGVMCECLKKLFEAEKRASLSNLLKLGNETFDNFKLDYYSNTPDPGAVLSPREAMEQILKACRTYAQTFGDSSRNLLFNGNPGLGKTYLSACIARVVSERGFSVVYDTAGTIFTKHEEYKFSKVDNLDEVKDELDKYFDCDLLIIDDLGTEVTSSVTNAALYDIVNTRLITNKKTIVNTNLSVGEIHVRYTDQIASRLEGEYLVLTFYGDDIRKIKNNL